MIHYQKKNVIKKKTTDLKKQLLQRKDALANMKIQKD